MFFTGILPQWWILLLLYIIVISACLPVCVSLSLSARLLLVPVRPRIFSQWKDRGEVIPFLLFLLLFHLRATVHAKGGEKQVPHASRGRRRRRRKGQ